jgi:hypothetical protein
LPKTNIDATVSNLISIPDPLSIEGHNLSDKQAKSMQQFEPLAE